MDDKIVTKRKRTSSGHRWSEKEIKQMLEEICELIKDNAESFEKPTAQKFYEKFCGKNETLSNIPWQVMKAKLRYLKQCYMNAREWKKNTGAGLLEEGKGETVTDYILKMCPYFETLQVIFGQRKGVNPGYIFSSSDGDPLVDITMESSNENAIFIDDYPHDQFVNEVGTSSLLSNVLSENEPKKKRQNAKPSSSTLAELVILQEKKIELDTKKLEWEMQKEHSLMELKQIEIQQQLEIKKMEMENNLEVAKLKLEAKRLDIETKTKTQ